MTLHTYTLSPARAGEEAYLVDIARIHLEAWLTNSMMRTIYYGPPSTYPGIIESNLQRHRQAFLEESELDVSGFGEQCRFAVVIDDGLGSDEESIRHGEASEGPPGTVIAGIKYYLVHPAPSPQAASHQARPEQSSTAARSWPPGINKALASHVWAQLVASRRRLGVVLGPYVLVDNLYTDPRHERRGAGSMLMRRALAEADDRGWPCMLEASPAGLRVYERVGFRPFVAAEWRREGDGVDSGDDVLWADLRRWRDGGDRGEEFSRRRLEENGGEKDGHWYSTIVMVRPARTTKASAR